jgi:hypothetical protein
MDAFSGQNLTVFMVAVVAVVVVLTVLAFTVYVPLILVAFLVLLFGISVPFMARKRNRDLTILRPPENREPRSR